MSVSQRQQPQGQATPTHSWGEVQLTTTGVCTPEGQQPQATHARAVTPRGTATEEKHVRGKPGEALCGRGKLLISKELQEKMSEQSAAEEITKKQEVSDRNCNTNDPNCAAHSLLGGAGMNPVQHMVTAGEAVAGGRIGVQLASSLGEVEESVYVSV